MKIPRDFRALMVKTHKTKKRYRTKNSRSIAQHAEQQKNAIERRKSFNSAPCSSHDSPDALSGGPSTWARVSHALSATNTFTGPIRSPFRQHRSATLFFAPLLLKICNFIVVSPTIQSIYCINACFKDCLHFNNGCCNHFSVTKWTNDYCTVTFLRNRTKMSLFRYRNSPKILCNLQRR